MSDKPGSVNQVKELTLEELWDEFLRGNAVLGSDVVELRRAFFAGALAATVRASARVAADSNELWKAFTTDVEAARRG